MARKTKTETQGDGTVIVTKGRKQARVDNHTRKDALQTWKDLAADYAEAAQRWKDARELRTVRLSDLVKAHENNVDDEQRLTVAQQASDAVAADQRALEAKHEAKSAVDAAWKIVRGFDGDHAPEPIFPDEKEDDEDAE